MPLESGPPGSWPPEARWGAASFAADIAERVQPADREDRGGSLVYCERHLGVLKVTGMYATGEIQRRKLRAEGLATGGRA